MDIDVRHLRMLVAVADAGSLSRAAAELGLTQPAVTVSLRRLETHVGDRLFTRGHSGVVPTELGHRLITRARVVLAEIEQLQSGAGHLSAESPLTFGLSYMTSTPSMMAAITGLLGARARFSTDGSTSALAHDLKHGTHDMSILLVSEDGQNELPSEVLSRVLQPSIPVFVALPATHRFAAREQIALADLAEERWIVPPGADDGSLAELRTACAEAGFMPDIRYIAPAGAGRRIIEENDAVQLVEPGTPNTERLVTRPLTGDPMRMRLVLAWQRDRVDRGLPDAVHRLALDAYARHARTAGTYGAWWARNRDAHVWVRHLDQVFSA